MPHPSALRLCFDLVPTDGAATVRKGTQPVAVLYCSMRMFGFDLRDFESNSSVFRHQSHTVARAVELPVRRKRDDTATVWTDNRSRPEVAIADPIVRLFGIKISDST